MSSLAEFIPIELVNHILSFRPCHPDAELIKELKKRLLVLSYDIWRIMRNSLTSYSMTFKELNDKTSIINYRIFSSCIRPNSIYKIKTKKYKTSEGFYWGKYYTEKKAYEEFEEAKASYYCGDIYSIELVNIDNDIEDEHTVETYYYQDDQTESEDEEEYEEDEY